MRGGGVLVGAGGRVVAADAHLAPPHPDHPRLRHLQRAHASARTRRDRRPPSDRVVPRSHRQGGASDVGGAQDGGRCRRAPRRAHPPLHRPPAPRRLARLAQARGRAQQDRHGAAAGALAVGGGAQGTGREPSPHRCPTGTQRPRAQESHPEGGEV